MGGRLNIGLADGLEDAICNFLMIRGGLLPGIEILNLS
jgi:hypothetical protein